jgi:hypothetical protein
MQLYGHGAKLVAESWVDSPLVLVHKHGPSISAQQASNLCPDAAGDMSTLRKITLPSNILEISTPCSVTFVRIVRSRMRLGLND